MATHLVTGSSGFLGSQIVERLSGMGEGVIALDVLQPPVRLEGVRYVTGNILDLEGLSALIAQAQYVHHNAALVPLTKAGKGFHEVNVVGTENVIECCRRHRIRKLVHMSSSAMYGIPDEIPITDKTPYRPVEIYGQSKLEADVAVQAYMKEGGRASCIRPRTIIGGRSRLGIFQILFEWILEGRNVYVMGDGSNLLQFVHVNDLINASMKAAFSEHDGLYNIGTDRYRSLREDLEDLIAFATSKSRVVGLPIAPARAALWAADKLKLSPLAPMHYLTYHETFVFDISKAMNELGWAPRYSNIEALRESYMWYLEHRHTLSADGRSIHTKPVREKLLRLVRWLS